MNTCWHSALASGQTAPALEAKHRRCVGKEDNSSGDWEREQVPGSHSPMNKREQGATAVGRDAVVKDMPDLLPWTWSSARKQWQSCCDPLPSPTRPPPSLLHYQGVTQKSLNLPPSVKHALPLPSPLNHSATSHSHHWHKGGCPRSSQSLGCTSVLISFLPLPTLPFLNQTYNAHQTTGKESTENRMSVSWLTSHSLLSWCCLDYRVLGYSTTSIPQALTWFNRCEGIHGRNLWKAHSNKKSCL